MRTIKLLAIVLTVATAQLFMACERRPLEEGTTYTTALIPVRVDWSASGVPLPEMHRATVMLFPEGGGAPLQYYLESDLHYRTIEVPVGVYSVIVFNETTSESDWNGISFTNTDSYDGFAAVGRADLSGRGIYTYSGELPLIFNPEPLAAWTLDRFEITPEKLRRSRTTSDIETEIPDLTVVVPEPRIEQITITAQVKNLSSSMQVTGTVDGMASGVYMVSGEKIPIPAAHAFILNGRVYDMTGKHGTTTRTFNIFGRLPGPATQHEMNLDFVLNDGMALPSEIFDVTDIISHDDNALPPANTLEVGYIDEGPDHSIVLPEMAVVGSGVTVDDWGEVVIPL